MSATSFIRRVSGLLVPKVTFAAPWLWIPCDDCDCGALEGFNCGDKCNSTWEEVAVDLGPSGWTDNGCDQCDEIWVPRVLTKLPSAPTGAACGWQQLVSEWCSIPTWGALTLQVLCQVTVLIPDTNLQWQVFVVLLRAASPQGVSLATYTSDVWNIGVEGGDECDFLADGNGDISLSITNDFPNFRGLPTPPCNGTAPATISIANANP